MRKRVAIACQGGGSHTAFTAGVLRGILKAKSRGAPIDVAAISGTSGGAICALLAWHGLSRGDLTSSIDNLKAFWTRPWPRGNAVANLPSNPLELFDCWWNVQTTAMGRSHVPEIFPCTFSPRYNPYSSDAITALLPWPFHDLFSEASDVRRTLKSLIARYVDDGAIREAASWSNEGPVLLVGAVDVCTGEFQVFRSSDSGFGLDAIVASAAIPELMKAVSTVCSSSDEPWRRGTFWDGLFSQNPPLREFPGLLAAPDDGDIEAAEEDPVEREIWVIRINPRSRKTEPRHVEEIADRRNELSGNLSLEQEIYFIERINQWLQDGRELNKYGDGSEAKKRYRSIKLRSVSLPSEELEGRGFTMDKTSKLDRSEKFLRTLLAEGERLSTKFTELQEEVADEYSPMTRQAVASGRPR